MWRDATDFDYRGMKHSRRRARRAPRQAPTQPWTDHDQSSWLFEQWNGGTKRNPADVVADYIARAPRSLRESARPLNRAERIYWRHLSNGEQLGVEVFRHVPVFLPKRELCRMLTFFIPRYAVCLELTDFDFTKGPTNESYQAMTYGLVDDERLLDHAGIMTMRFPQAIVKKDATIAVRVLRAELGLSDDSEIAPFDVPP